MSLADWLRFARSLGLDGADLSVAHLGGLSREDLRGVRRVADTEGIHIAILAAYSDFTHPDAAKRHQEAESLRRWIEVAFDLGAPYIRVTAGQAHPEIEDAVGALSWIATGLTSCLEDAAAAGVTLLYRTTCAAICGSTTTSRSRAKGSSACSRGWILRAFKCCSTSPTRSSSARIRWTCWPASVPGSAPCTSATCAAAGNSGRRRSGPVWRRFAKSSACS